jgi:hypothetical protein
VPCRNRALEGALYCGMHGEKVHDRAPKPRRVTKQPKPKKVQPEHTHEVGASSVVGCPLCETHGDVWDPVLSEAEFVCSEK